MPEFPARAGKGLPGSGVRHFDENATPEPAGRGLLAEAAERLKLSARGYHRVMRVARTLADLEGAAAVARIPVAEALSYRRVALPRQVPIGPG